MDLFALSARLTLDSSEYESGLSQAENRSGMFASILKANLITKGVEVCVKGLARLGGAAANVFKGAIDSYADYEQLVGGVETLFGSSAKKVISDADQAFKTAGMSANQYMETSIQSAASLINSLGGDQKKAAELMNLSVTDMADNVNKMGTSMEGVQNAYRGFSRGNFTMLDNLALGFAGTKEGMQQLLDKAHEISGVKYDISSYADIVQAIHIVQTNMGITGTTAEEASKTISGSIGMLKSAWENLITGMGEGNEVKLDGLVNAVVDAAKTVFANVMPVAEKAIYGFIHLIEASVPVLLETVPGMVSRLAPRLVKAAGTLVTSIGKSLPSLMSSIVKNLPQALKSVERFIIVWVGGAMGRLWSNLAGYKIPTNQSIFQNLFTRLFDLLDKAAGKVKEFWTVVVQPIVQDLAKLGQRITHAIVLLLDGLKPIWEEVSPKISKAFQDIAGFWRDTLFPILDSIIFYVTTRLVPDIVEWVGIAVDFVGKAFVAIGQFWSDTLYPTLRRIWAYVTNTVVPNAVEAWNQFREKAREVFAKIRDFWNDPLKPTLDNIRKLIVEEVVPKVIEAWGNFKEKAQSAFDAVALYWNDHLYPVIWYIWFLITQYVVPKVVEAWGVFRTKAEETFTNLAPIIEESLSNGQKNLTDFTDAIGAIADGDWTTAIQKFESIVERTFNSVGDLIKDAVKPAINDVIGWLNGLIAKVESGLNWIVDGLNKVLSFSWGELKIGPVKIWDAGSVHLDLEHVVLDRLQKIGEETYGAGRNKGYGRHDFFANGGILGEGQSAFVGEYAPELLRVIGGKAMVTPLSKVPARFPGGPETFEPRVAKSRPVTVIMQVGEKEFGRLAFELGSAEEQRVGVKLAKGGAY